MLSDAVVCGSIRLNDVGCSWFDMGRCGSMIWMDAVDCVRMNECGLIRANSFLIRISQFENVSDFL